MKKMFDVDCELDTTHLHFLLDKLTESNSSDADIIKKLQEEYVESSWFSVISFAEQVIYG